MASSSTVSGVVMVDGVPASRRVRVFSYDDVAHDINGETKTLARSLGHSTSDPVTGEYSVDLLGGYENSVFVVAFDDYGAGFAGGQAVVAGDRIHPAQPNGYVYECDGAGGLPTAEPDPWPVDDSQSHLIGTASFSVKPFYRPLVHGPIYPEVTGSIQYKKVITGDSPLTYWRLSQDAGYFTDELEGYDGDEVGSVDRVAASLLASGENASVDLAGTGAIEGPGAPIWDSGASGWSVELWVRPSANVSAIAYLYTELRIGGAYKVLLRTESDGRLRLDKYPGSGGSAINSTVALEEGQIYHIVYTEDSVTSEARIWVNGVIDGSGTAETYSGSAPQYWALGQRPYYNDFRFNGIIDEAATYDRVLTQEEIENHYIAGTAS